MQLIQLVFHSDNYVNKCTFSFWRIVFKNTLKRKKSNCSNKQYKEYILGKQNKLEQNSVNSVNYILNVLLRNRTVMQICQNVLVVYQRWPKKTAQHLTQHQGAVPYSTAVL